MFYVEKNMFQFLRGAPARQGRVRGATANVTVVGLAVQER
jgi:hypothetical protein